MDRLEFDKIFNVETKEALQDLIEEAITDGKIEMSEVDKNGFLAYGSGYLMGYLGEWLDLNGFLKLE